MIIIGEKINSSIPKSEGFIKNSDTDGIIALAKAQLDGGADYLDVNAGTFADEEEKLLWLITVLQEKFGKNVPLMVDSPDGNTLVSVLEKTKIPRLIVNSVTLEARYNEVVPFISEKIKEGNDISLVAMPVSDVIPKEAKERTELSVKLLERLTADGIPHERIFLDVLTESMAMNDFAAIQLFETLKFVKSRFPRVKAVCGLSNISFGLPKRIRINSAMIAMLTLLKIDAMILDCASVETRAAIRASALLCGEDEYCMDYIDFIRDNFDI